MEKKWTIAAVMTAIALVSIGIAAGSGQFISGPTTTQINSTTSTVTATVPGATATTTQLDTLLQVNELWTVTTTITNANTTTTVTTTTTSVVNATCPGTSPYC